jgi:dolichyl-diphosphooligosaccharide--protein glycosyltransferase
MIIMRGPIGWFKSEPLGLFYGLLAAYLFLSGIKSNNGKISLAKIAGGGILLAFGVASWGGVQFFIIPIGFFILALPFLRKDNKFVVPACVIFVSAFILITMSFEKTGITFATSLSGFFLIGCTGFLVATSLVRKISSKVKPLLVLLGGVVIAGIAVASSGILSLPAFRYLNAANPFLTASDTLTQSISEHQTLSLEDSFFFSSILMVFAGIGVWLIFQNRVNRSFKIKGDMAVFALIIGIIGVYFSSSFIRLEVFGSISVIILSSIGISILASKILNNHDRPIRRMLQFSFIGIIVVLLTIPTALPIGGSWITGTVVPPTILNGGNLWDSASNDWPHAMQWVRENTPKDAVIAAWWDYGYWITALGDRKSLADNATLIDWQIEKIAKMFFSTPENAWHILATDTKTDVSSYYGGKILEYTKEKKIESFKSWKDNLSADGSWKHCLGGIAENCKTRNVVEENYEKYPTLFDYWVSKVWQHDPRVTALDADYVLVNIAAYRIPDAIEDIPLYLLGDKGGDETKAWWIIKIAGLPLMDYYYWGGESFSDEFWNNTLLGNLIPFTPVLYVDPITEEQSMTFKSGYVTVYVRDVKFPTNNEGPFELVYMSPSLDRTNAGNINGVIIYKVNQGYIPNS